MSSEAPDVLNPAATARAFVEAVAWGEHHRIWRLLGLEGRASVLRIATGRGMDPTLAARLREGTATIEEREQFLVDLVNGLRVDLAGADLDSLEYSIAPGATTPAATRVVLSSPLPALLGGSLPVGWLELSQHAGRWWVDRLTPHASR